MAKSLQPGADAGAAPRDTHPGKPHKTKQAALQHAKQTLLRQEVLRAYSALKKKRKDAVRSL